MIYFDKVSKLYNDGRQAALEEVTFQIDPKEFVSIVGQSGAGKTTLVRILIGEERVDSGQVVVGGWDITKISKHEVPFLCRIVFVSFSHFINNLNM